MVINGIIYKNVCLNWHECGVHYILQRRYILKVNGKYVALGSGITLKEFLESRGYNLQRIAVERNSEIVSRENFDVIRLNEGDTIEVVSFVGGG